jgi:hypothetical protein
MHWKDKFVRLRRGVHCAPPSESSINIGSWPSMALRHGRSFRVVSAASTASVCRSLARICHGASGITCSAGRIRSLIRRRIA